MTELSIPKAFNKALLNGEEVLAVTKKTSIVDIRVVDKPNKLNLSYFNFGTCFLI